MSDQHRDIIKNTFFGLNNRFTQYVVYAPLSVTEFRALTQEPATEELNDTQLDRLWLKPIQRWLQEEYRIDQRNFDTGTIPSSTELEEDFKVATAITIDHFYKNQEGVVGQESVVGAGTRRWSHSIPPRAAQILQRYARLGGNLGRA
jgi:hypothetical protein